MMKKTVLAIACALLFALSASADEGMWMVNAISRALERNMVKEGLQMTASEIYNEDGTSLTDAIVSLDFGCTGSIVSDQGLLITNHHCAYSDVFNLSTLEHNYLEDGFWAFKSDEEVPIPGKHVQFLRKVIDVTEEVQMVVDSLSKLGQQGGMRKISYIVERKYKATTGLEASLASMWAGSKYYLALYEEYSDIRLVAAPPVSIAAYGGDVDNWEWPQHKCDFAFYRVYTAPDGSPAEYSPENVPLQPRRVLKVNSEGYKPGDFTMVIGFPGITNRYDLSSVVEYKRSKQLPVTNRLRKEQMAIISYWMDADPEVRLKYADYYFSLSNVQELNEGEVECFTKYNVVAQKQKQERKVRHGRKYAREIDEKYDVLGDALRNTLYFRETLIRGTKLALVATRLKNNKKFVPESMYPDLDLRVEHDLMAYALKEFYANVDRSYWGPYQASLYDSLGTASAVCEYLWIDRPMTKEDPIFHFFTDVQISEYNHVVDSLQEGRSVRQISSEYKRALYHHNYVCHKPQYPDANSTMRITYGTVCSFVRDGVEMPWQTYGSEILAKEDTTQHDFALKPEWRDLLAGRAVKGPAVPPVDFITNNDITGGNSGSPVMNARGELIGLAFDGNKESLASDASFTPAYNRCVCVDIRFVLWTLERYAHLDRILAELR